MAHMMVQPRPRRALKTFFIVLLVILLLLLACAGFFVVKALVSPTSAFSSTVPILPDADGDTSDPEAKQLAALEGVSTRQAYRDHDAAVEKISALMFGIDALDME